MKIDGSKLKHGDRFGVLVGPAGSPHNWLYCEVLGEDGGIIYGEVINGRWDFYFDWRAGTARYAHYYDKSLLTDWRLGYTGPFPKGLDLWDYNAAIVFMDTEVSRRPAERMWTHFWWQVQRWVYARGSFFRRLKTATTAFKNAWSGGRPEPKKAVPKKVAEQDDYDDNIPF